MADFRTIVHQYQGVGSRWSQGRFLQDNTFGRGGACAPLAAKWIRDRKAVIKFKQDTATPEGRDEVMQLNMNKAMRAYSYVEDYLRLCGLTKQFAQHVGQAMSLDALMAIVAEQPAYYHLGLLDGTLTVRSGHAFAFDTYTFKFFDPDYGQASFDSLDDMLRAFRAWYRVVYLHLNEASTISRFT